MGEPSRDQQLQDVKNVFLCRICYDDLKNPHLCPSCSNYFCFECIKKWMLQTHNCPYCKKKLNQNQLVKLRWHDELKNLQELTTTEIIKQAEGINDQCAVHAKTKSVYCSSCEICICGDCVFECEEHTGHTFKKLATIHKVEIAKIQNVLDTTISELDNARLQNLDFMNRVSIAKGGFEYTLDNAFKKMRDDYFGSFSNDLEFDGAMRNVRLIENINELTQLAQVLSTNQSPTEILNQRSSILSKCDTYKVNERNNPIPEFKEFQSELVTEFRCGTMVLENLENIHCTHFYSNKLIDETGSIWRLKVEKIYQIYKISLELFEGILGTYSYWINWYPQPGNFLSTKEFKCEFEFTNENRSCQCAQIESAIDGVIIKFAVRHPDLVVKCRNILQTYNSNASNMLPDYCSGIFLIEKISELQVIPKYSKIIVDDTGTGWRLKVNTIFNNEKWLGAYMEMVHGISGWYEFRVDIMHPDSTKIQTLQMVKDFEDKSSHGWRDIANFVSLFNGGYVNTAKDILEIRFFVRPANMRLKCEYQKRYIELLMQQRNGIIEID